MGESLDTSEIDKAPAFVEGFQSHSKRFSRLFLGSFQSLSYLCWLWIRGEDQGEYQLSSGLQNSGTTLICT